MSDDERTALEEELAASQAEIERLQTMAADREARAAQLREQVAEARAALDQARDEAQTREGALRAEHEALAAEIAEAARRYRDLALQHEPDLPQDLVAGATVAEIDRAIEDARETVSRVRGHLEALAQAGRVPVGAPVRSAPDRSSLSAGEKISLGLQDRPA